MFSFSHSHRLAKFLLGEQRIVFRNPEDLGRRAGEIGDALKAKEQSVKAEIETKKDKAPKEVQEKMNTIRALRQHAVDVMLNGEKEVTKIQKFAVQTNVFLHTEKIMIGNGKEPARISPAMFELSHLKTIITRAGWGETVDEAKVRTEQNEKKEVAKKNWKEVRENFLKMGLDRDLGAFLRDPVGQKDTFITVMNAQVSSDFFPAGTDIPTILQTLVDAKIISREKQREVLFRLPGAEPSKTSPQYRRSMLMQRAQAEREQKEFVSFEAAVELGLEYGKLWGCIQTQLAPLKTLHNWRNNKPDCIEGMHYHRYYVGRQIAVREIPWDFSAEYQAAYDNIRPMLERLLVIEERLKITDANAGGFIKDDIHQVYWRRLNSVSANLANEWRSVKPGEVIRGGFDPNRSAADVRYRTRFMGMTVVPRAFLMNPGAVQGMDGFLQYEKQEFQGDTEKVTVLPKHPPVAVRSSHSMPQAPEQKSPGQNTEQNGQFQKPEPLPPNATELQKVQRAIVESEGLLARLQATRKRLTEPKNIQEIDKSIRKVTDMISYSKQQEAVLLGSPSVSMDVAAFEKKIDELLKAIGDLRKQVEELEKKK